MKPDMDAAERCIKESLEIATVEKNSPSPNSFSRAVEQIDRKIAAHNSNIKLLEANFPGINEGTLSGAAGSLQRRARATINNLNAQIKALGKKKKEVHNAWRGVEK